MPEFTFYTIVSKDENIKDCYIGKTTNFKNRIREHKSSCYNENSKKYNLKLYQYIRENGGINNWNFIEIETNKYDDKDSAIRERYWVENLNATLNSLIPSRTLKEYYEKNRKELNEYQKEYLYNNKDIIKKKAKEYRNKNIEIIKEKQKEYRKNNKEKIKEYQNKYRNNNKEYLNEKHKEYRKNNKEIIKEKAKDKINCICGCEITKSNLSTHLKSQKHINLMS